MSKSVTTVVLGDVHFPDHDRAAVELATQVIEAVRPDRVIQIGDLLDARALSTHDKDPAKGTTLQGEIDAAMPYLDRWRAASGSVVVCSGNHEERLQRRLSQESDLASTHPGMRELLGLRKDEWVPYRTHRRFGLVAYTHDLGHAGTGALRQNLLAFGGCVVTGHTHRAGIVYGGDTRGSRHFAMEVGTLCDIDSMTYLPAAKRKDWQHGIGFVREVRGLAFASFHAFVDGLCVVDGQVFGTNTKRAKK